jgi:hypothetical protein
MPVIYYVRAFERNRLVFSQPYVEIKCGLPIYVIKGKEWVKIQKEI